MVHAAAAATGLVKLSGGDNKNYQTMSRDNAAGHFRGRPIDNAAARTKVSEATIRPPHRRGAATGPSRLNLH